MRTLLLPLALVAAPAVAQTTAGAFTIAGQRFATASIIDARALPALDGGATILVTFDPAGAKQLAALTRANAGKALAIALDGKVLATPTVHEPVDSGTVEIVTKVALAEAEAIAKHISGKDPVPEEFDQ